MILSALIEMALNLEGVSTHDMAMYNCKCISILDRTKGATSFALNIQVRFFVFQCSINKEILNFVVYKVLFQLSETNIIDWRPLDNSPNVRGRGQNPSALLLEKPKFLSLAR
jgi:hypothetical protein